LFSPSSFYLLIAISMIDRQTQYFLAGSTRTGAEVDLEIVFEGDWFGCKTVGTPHGLCEVLLSGQNNSCNANWIPRTRWPLIKTMMSIRVLRCMTLPRMKGLQACPSWMEP
jgi:hypothetical protein